VDVNLIRKWKFLWGLSCLETRKWRNFLLETKMEEKIAPKSVCDDDEILSSAPWRLYPRTLYQNNICSCTLYIIFIYICTKYMYKFVYMRYLLCRKTHIDVFNFFIFFLNKLYFSFTNSLIENNTNLIFFNIDESPRKLCMEIEK
jgi:hypothetical protein